MMYSCSKCKNILSEENFCNNKARHNGKSAYCKNCDNERKKTYSKTEKGKIANKRRQRRVDKSKIKEYQKISNRKWLQKWKRVFFLPCAHSASSLFRLAMG